MTGFSKNDKYVLIVSVILLFVLYNFTWTTSVSSQFVSVYVNAEKRYTIDLAENDIIEINGTQGVSKLEVLNGKVRFIESPCSTHFCIRSGWLGQAIGLIACLPNGVSLSFSNGVKTYDAINF